MSATASAPSIPASQQSGPVPVIAVNAIPSTYSGKTFRGKGGKMGGKMGARHNLATSTKTLLTNKPTLRRQAMRGGCKRFSGLTYGTATAAGGDFLKKILRDAITYTQHARRKTIAPVDVKHSLWNNNHIVYGATETDWLKDGKRS